MPRFADYRTAIFVVLLLTSVVGCAPEMAGLRQRFAHPGPVAYQRDRAIHNDPYVLNDLGPEVVGGRPREFMIPLSEVDRAKLDAPVPPGLAPVPAPAVVVGPPPAGGSPAVVTVPVPGALSLPPAAVAASPIVTTPVPAAPMAPPSPFPAQNRAPY